MDIIFIEGNSRILDRLIRNKRKKVCGCSVLYVANGAEALKSMSLHDSDVMIVDADNPNTDTAQLLKTIKENYPNTIRIILTDYKKQEKMEKYIGLAHQCFSKPCETAELVQSIVDSTRLYRRLNRPQLQKLICNLHALPSLPNTYLKLKSALEEPDPSIETVASVIAGDPAISMKMLQMVNSAFFGRGRTVSDIQEATMFLGMEIIKSLVLVIGIVDQCPKDISKVLNLESYAMHAMEVGQLCQTLAKRMKWTYQQQQTVFSCGLLHDVGKLILAANFQLELEVAGEDILNGNEIRKRLAKEQYSLGTNHAEIGAALAALWGLPSSVVNAIAFHHNPGYEPQATSLSYTGLVHIANAFARLSFDSDITLSDNDLFDQHYLEKTKMTDIVSEWIESFAEESII